jgi:hypothetical protein
MTAPKHAALLSTLPARARVDLNLVFVRLLFVVLVGRILIFVGVPLLLVFAYCVSSLTEVLQEFRRDITGKVWFFF